VHLLATVAIVAVGFALAARAEPVAVGETILEFDPGAGFCRLDRSAGEFDALMLDWQDQAHTGINAVVAVYMDCAKLDLARQGSDDLGTYGMMLAPLLDGKLEPMPGASRADVLAELAAYVDTEVEGLEEDVEARTNAALDAMTGGEAGEIALSGMQQLGLLDQDDVALYTGLLITVADGGEAERMAGVAALTFVGGYMVSYSLYGPFADAGTHVALVADLKPIMQRFVTANDDVVPVGQVREGDSGTSEGRRFRAIAFGVVLVAGAVAVFVRRRRVRRG
jgi:hypothetical protein